MVVLNRMKVFRLFIYIILHLIAFCSFSQTLDPNFHLPTPIKAASIISIKMQQDGKMLLAGNIQFFEKKRVNNLIRLNQDGTLDETFSFAPANSRWIRKIDLLSTGEIIIAGNYTLTKLSSLGQILNEVDSIQDINSIVIQNDDKIIITAYQVHGHYAQSSSMYRLNSDLSLDRTFNQSNSFNGWVQDAAMQDDKIIVSGSFSEVNKIVKNDLVRFDSNGNLDHSFDTGSGTSDGVGFITIQEDGRILLGHTYINSFNGIPFNGSGIIRLNADGSVDSSFNTNSQIRGSFSKAFLQGSDILIAGTIRLAPNSSHTYSMCRLKSSGELDLSFTPIEISSKYTEMMLDNSGNIIINNKPLDNYRYELIRINSEGQVDKSFNPAVGAYGEINTGDYFNGQLVVGGVFVRIGDTYTCNLAKINLDGTVDTNFIIEPSLTSRASSNRQPGHIKIINADTILVALGNKLIRLNGKGEEDQQFISQGVEDPYYFADKFQILENRKIVTSSPNGVFMLNADGSPNVSFNEPRNRIASTDYFGIQSNGIVHASSTMIEGNARTTISKLDFDGATDLTFDSGSGTSISILHIGVVKNDDILVTGRFDEYSGIPTRDLVKLYSDGKVDISFTNSYNATAPAEYNFLLGTTPFRDGSLISAAVPNGYTLGFVNADGIYDTYYNLPAAIISVNRKVIPIVVNADSLILLSQFQLSGQTDPSFALRLIFNDRPKITATTTAFFTPEDTPLALKLSDLQVTDADSSFPDGFSLIIHEGENYSVENLHIIPDSNYHGNLNVPVTVSDGKNESDLFNITLKVIPVADTIENITVLISGSTPVTNNTLVSIIFSESVKDFHPSDINITNGSISELTTEDSVTFTATITPVSDGKLTVEITSGAVFDKTGNPNQASNLFAFEYDGTHPTVKLSKLENDTNQTVPLSVLLTFSEAVKGFSSEDIRLTNGSLSELISTDSNTFIAHILPNANEEITVKIPSGAAQDLAGNDNEPSETLNIFYKGRSSFTLTIGISNSNLIEMPAATATLYQKADGKFTVVAKKEISNSLSLSFEDLAEGEYTIGIRAVEKTFLPTYLGSMFTLWNARTINVYKDTLQNVSLLENPENNPVGGCVISGIILHDTEAEVNNGRILTGNATTTGEAIANVPVYLIHPETRKVVVYAVTDQQGKFSFTDLHAEDYLFAADYEGLPMDEAQNLIHLKTDFETVSITAIASSNIRITDIQSEKQVTFVEDEVLQHTIRYYPNPVVYEILIDHADEWIGGEVTVRDAMGKLIKTQPIVANLTFLNLEVLTPGIYFINLIKGKNHFSFKTHKN